MGSNTKKRTTFAKMNREQKLRERRAEKEARKAARKLAGPVEHTFEPTVESLDRLPADEG